MRAHPILVFGVGLVVGYVVCRYHTGTMSSGSSKMSGGGRR